MKSFLKIVARRVLTENSYKYLGSYYRQLTLDPRKLWVINKFQRGYPAIVERLQNKEKIKVAFFLIHASVWKFDEIFRLMQADDRFDPLVVICPYITYGDEVMQRDMDQSERFVKSKKYPYVVTFDKKTEKWVDVKNEINPDIIFFTNPHDLTKKEYYIPNFPNTLNCYVPYAFMAVGDFQDQLQFNQIFHNLIWTQYYETDIHKEIARKNALYKGKNVFVSGYPGCDVFLYGDKYQARDVWKIEDRNIKRVIWSPHHLVDGSEISNFLKYSGIMMGIARKYSDKIQITFRPHPILLSKLYVLDSWGKERADRYYQEWDNLPNGQYYEDDYTDLFLTSDALIHDCGSFISEYVATGNPALFMISNDKIMSQFNAYGKKAIGVHYKSYCPDDVIDFIENVVVGSNDTMKNERLTFIENVLKNDQNISASTIIYNHIRASVTK